MQKRFFAKASSRSFHIYRIHYLYGKENDKDISNGGQDYGMRIYDTRLGRFLSVDPITQKYPELTPYQFASNKVINSIDLDGLECWDLSTPLNNLRKQAQIHLQKSDAIANFKIEVQRGMSRPVDIVVDSRTAHFNNYLSDPDNMGGRAAYGIYQDVQQSKAAYREGDWLMGTVHAFNAGVNTTTLVGASEYLGFKYSSDIKAEPWVSKTDENYVGSLANRLGNNVLGIDVKYNFSGGKGDVDILTKGYNVEVKSGKKMELEQS